MKTRTLVSIIISVSIGFMIISGCASTGTIKEPQSPESTLLIGRIKLVVFGFPGKVRDVNGAYTDGVIVYLKNASREELIKVKSHGRDGIFYLIDPEPGPYVIIGFEKYIRTDTARVTLRYVTEDYPYFFITNNCVNNLGDINWYENYVGKIKFKRENLVTDNRHVFFNNPDYFEFWFNAAYHDSAWINKRWIDVEIVTNQ